MFFLKKNKHSVKEKPIHQSMIKVRGGFSEQIGFVNLPWAAQHS